MKLATTTADFLKYTGCQIEALQDAAEAYLYRLGRTILESYDCFEE